MPSLRDILDAAPPGPWQIPATACWFWGAKEVRSEPMERFEAQSQIVALAPELAALALEMGEALTTLNTMAAHRDSATGFLIESGIELNSLLARLDALGEGQA